MLTNYGTPGNRPEYRDRRHARAQSLGRLSDGNLRQEVHTLNADIRRFNAITSRQIVAENRAAIATATEQRLPHGTAFRRGDNEYVVVVKDGQTTVEHCDHYVVTDIWRAYTRALLERDDAIKEMQRRGWNPDTSGLPQ